MPTYLEKLPVEIYEKIFTNDYDDDEDDWYDWYLSWYLNYNLDVWDKAKLLEIRPVSSKLFLDSLKLPELKDAFRSLNTSKLDPTFVEEIVGQLLTPEIMKKTFRGIYEKFGEKHDWDPTSMLMATDEDEFPTLTAHYLADQFTNDSVTILAKNSEHVPQSSEFLRKFLMIFYDDFFVECITGKFGIENKTTLETYIKNYASHPERIHHFSKASNHRDLALTSWSSCFSRNILKARVSEDREFQKFLEFESSQLTHYTTTRFLRALFLEKQTIFLTVNLVKDEDVERVCFDTLLKQYNIHKEKVSKVLTIIETKPKNAGLYVADSDSGLEVFCRYHKEMKKLAYEDHNKKPKNSGDSIDLQKWQNDKLDILFELLTLTEFDADKFEKLNTKIQYFENEEEKDSSLKYNKQISAEADEIMKKIFKEYHIKQKDSEPVYGAEVQFQIDYLMNKDDSD